MDFDALKELKRKESDVCMVLLYGYGFHDAAFSSLTVDGMQVVMEFKEGVFRLDEYGRDTELTGKCRLILDFYDDPLLSIEIFRVKFGIVRQIGIRTLQNSLMKGEFRIERQSYSSFQSRVCFQGYIGSDRFELAMCNVIRLSMEIDTAPEAEAEPEPDTDKDNEK